MAEQTVTAAAVISFSQKLEDGSGSFYEELARRFPEQGETFLGYAKDCAKNKVTITRTYQETITDAIEACYAFEGLTLGDPMFHLSLKQGSDLAGALEVAIKLEEQSAAFYLQVADCSQALLATIPGAFRKVARNRNKRKQELQSLQ